MNNPDTPLPQPKFLIAGTGEFTITGSPVVLRWGGGLIVPTSPILVQALVIRESKVDDGFTIRAVEPAWAQISALVAHDPDALFRFSPEQLEELVAASYDKAGYDEVILTPRSGDCGRDVIATRKGWGSVRIVDQVKCYKAGHLVDANDVRALLGVLHSDKGASKGIVTTSSSFAPRIESDPLIAPQIPYRLELVDGATLRARLIALSGQP